MINKKYDFQEGAGYAPVHGTDKVNTARGLPLQSWMGSTATSFGSEKFWNCILSKCRDCGVTNIRVQGRLQLSSYICVSRLSCLGLYGPGAVLLGTCVNLFNPHNNLIKSVLLLF